jgi:hypothetical protein
LGNPVLVSHFGHLCSKNLKIGGKKLLKKEKNVKIGLFVCVSIVF